MSKVFESENQFILRVPPEIAEKLHAKLDGEDGDDFIDITPNIISNRQDEEVTQFKFNYDGLELRASLLDLPCIIESQKSIDSIN